MAESNYQTVFHFEVLEDGVLAMRPVGALTVATMEMGFAQLAERLSKLSGPVRVCVQTGQAQIKEAGAVRFAARFLTTRSDIGKWAVADLSGPKVFLFSSVLMPLAKTSFPMRGFRSLDEALAWLRE